MEYVFEPEISQKLWKFSRDKTKDIIISTDKISAC
jgi:hypothetical protein